MATNYTSDSNPASPIHSTDPRRFRATYNVPYPTTTATISTRSDLTKLSKLPEPTDTHKLIDSSRVEFNVRFIDIDSIRFDKCNFHHKKGKDYAYIANNTFRNCSFSQSILGTTVFQSTRFYQCSFRQCDFQNAIFDGCLFVDCTFERCTGLHIAFRDTEIDPSAFLKGFEFPSWNFDGASPDEREKWQTRWLSVRAEVARQLLRSSLTSHNTKYTDEALQLLKRTELKLREQRKRLAISTLFEKANLLLTKGGTSLGRLLALAMIVVATVTAALLVTNEITFLGQSTFYAGPLSIAHAFWASLALFFGFGFTGFSSTTHWHAMAFSFISMLGIVWYAMAIPVLVRRIYR